MSGTHNLSVGDRGRVVLPAALRTSRNWQVGTALVAVETESGVILATREDLLSIVQGQLAGVGLVESLLSDRRAESHREDSE